MRIPKATEKTRKVHLQVTLTGVPKKASPRKLPKVILLLTEEKIPNQKEKVPRSSQ